MSFYGTRNPMPRKTCQFRLSRNSMKFDMLATFRETIPMTKSISSSEIQKYFGFLPKLRFFPFSENLNFLRSYTMATNRNFFWVGAVGSGPTILIHHCAKGQRLEIEIRYYTDDFRMGTSRWQRSHFLV